MKVCIITCHDVYNHGASLQSYALMKYLEKTNNKVEIIDYKPDYLSNHYKLLAISNPKYEKNIILKSVYIILKFPERFLSLKRKRAFDRFKNDYLKITGKRYRSNEELKKDIPKADVYICGSDQIWNSLHKNGRDPAFYLNFVPENKIKVSYAASFATDFIEDKYKNLVVSNVEKLDGVAVRESSGVKILNDLGINNAINVVDPVFLLSKDEWNKICNKEFKEKYILVYDFDNNKLIENIARDIANKYGYKIYTICSERQGYEDKSFHFEGPDTFVSLVKDAKFVISNSFHAVVFSIIYEKQFIVVNRTEAINTRMRDLVQGLELGSRLVNDNYDMDKICKDINYTKVKKNLNNKIKISKNYLSNILSIKK